MENWMVVEVGRKAHRRHDAVDMAAQAKLWWRRRLSSSLLDA
jgi:hypothetical protein